MARPNVLQFKLFDQFPELVHGISTSDFGNVSYKWAEANSQTAEDIRLTRQQFYGFLSVPEESVVATQVEGGVIIHDVTAADRGKGVVDPDTGLTGDGFFTQETGVSLFMITGDCLALFFYEPVKGVCGLVHAGWRGVDQELPRIAVEHMVQRYGCDASQIIVGISPGLQKESATFEHFKDFNPANQKKWQPYIERIEDHYRADWIRYAKDQLIAAGISLPYIEDSAIDTRTNTEYYSHRRSKEENIPEARFGCLIGLKNIALGT